MRLEWERQLHTHAHRHTHTPLPPGLSPALSKAPSVGRLHPVYMVTPGDQLQAWPAPHAWPSRCPPPAPPVGSWRAVIPAFQDLPRGSAHSRCSVNARWVELMARPALVPPAQQPPGCYLTCCYKEVGRSSSTLQRKPIASGVSRGVFHVGAAASASSLWGGGGGQPHPTPSAAPPRQFSSPGHFCFLLSGSG